MEGSILPVPVAHGEGRAELKKDGVEDLYQKKLIPLVYVDDDEKATESYPQNPNGSIHGISGVTNESGTVTLMMPHPERSFLSLQHSWCPKNWDIYGPWIKFFTNAREFIG